MNRLLVANRGEIALRVLAAAADLGLGTVAIAPADDRTTRHVDAADDAVELPGTGPAAYLDVEAVVAAAQKSGADALHPGYGFLSENPALARACAEAGVTFVGPDPAVLELFGDKARSKEHARAVGVDVLEATAPEQARAFLDRVGAVMVKAVAGGGGRGMRAVRDPADLDDALARAASEAAAAFGDPTVVVERLLPRARHVEVQVAGDGSDVVVLSDRDCSAQRRHQKLVEIAPAPALDDDVRAGLHDAARRIVAPVGLRGLATVEFLVDGATTAFLEVNPRLQVEHTVTEEVLGLDLVTAQLRLADGADLRAAGLDPVPAVRGTAVQARVCTETLHADGTVTPQAGTLTRFTPPTGRGVRIETHGHAGHTVSPRYDSLLAKVVVHDPAGDATSVLARAGRCLRAFEIDGVPTNLEVLTALLDQPGLAVGALDTGFVDRHAAELAPEAEDAVDEPDGDVHAVRAPTAGVVVAVERAAGDTVGPDATLVVLEAMKMEHVVTAGVAGAVAELRIAVGDDVTAGAVLATVTPGDADADQREADASVDPDHVRPDLAESLERHRVTTDAARPQAVAKRRDVGRRTARENLADLLDEGSFVEYGALALAAQRRRRSVEDLVARTPADGIVTGTGTVEGRRIAVLAYDYTVMAGTQGVLNHAKTDRLLRLALDHGLPVVLFAEGGGGRPGDTDSTAVASLDVTTFALFAQLSGRVPTVAVVAGYCFAGNAALAGCAELIVGTRDLSLGMGGPAMIEGGGLGAVAPGDVGPADVQGPNGVLDVVVDDEAEAVAVTKRYLGFCAGPTDPVTPHDQRTLRHAVPENRLRVYDVRRVLHTIADPDTVLELRPAFGVGMITAFARVGGRPVGVLANDPRHLGGAIDAPAADKAARFLQLCDARGLPVVSLCDTPGFMVGPDAERTATVRRFSRMFVAGANARVPVVCVVLRKGYGLGAMAMAAGHLHRPVITAAWPTSEFGGMGLEGAVHLGYRQELEALTGEARKARFDELVGAYYERGKGLSVASVFEVDDVVDPAATRDVVLAALDTAGDDLGPRHPIVDTW
ncbi:acetyl-CoA carboxylase family protein [Actinomycetospora sp. C-140]